MPRGAPLGDRIRTIPLPAFEFALEPFRVVAVVPDTAYANATGTVFYPEVIVKINNPQLTALTGVDYTA